MQERALTLDRKANLHVAIIDHLPWTPNAGNPPTAARRSGSMTVIMFTVRWKEHDYVE